MGSRTDEVPGRNFLLVVTFVNLKLRSPQCCNVQHSAVVALVRQY